MTPTTAITTHVITHHTQVQQLTTSIPTTHGTKTTTIPTTIRLTIITTTIRTPYIPTTILSQLT